MRRPDRGRPERQQPRPVDDGRDGQPDQRPRPDEQEVQRRPGREGERGAGRGQRHRQQQCGDQRTSRREDDRGHARRHRPDRSRLERPQDVVATRPEEQHDGHRAERPDRPGLAPDDDVDDQRDDDMERERHRQVRPVRRRPDRPEEHPIEQDEGRTEVLVVRLEQAVDRQVALEDERPFVVVEGHVASEPDERDESDDHEQERCPDRPSVDVPRGIRTRIRGGLQGGHGGSKSTVRRWSRCSTRRALAETMGTNRRADP